MSVERTYKCIQKHTFSDGPYSLSPIRDEDKYVIMQIRNEQMYHLRQSRPLTEADQERYFTEVIAALFDVEQPSQLLFSFFDNTEFVGYGGLVHIDWINRNAEISFVMKTELEEVHFETYWCAYLNLLEQIAFGEAGLHKIFTYAYDIRPHLYPALEKSGFQREAVLSDHCFFDGAFRDVVIHSKISRN